MLDYERLINSFFYNFNITIITKLEEKKLTISPECYSITYRNDGQANNGLVVRFSFIETDNLLKADINCSYSKDALNSLRFDGTIFKNELALGLKCIKFLEHDKIAHSYEFINVSATLNKASGKIVFGDFKHTAYMSLTQFRTKQSDLVLHVSKLVDSRLNALNMETKNVSLNDKLDLMAMIHI
jgi:hypothetical protein